LKNELETKEFLKFFFSPHPHSVHPLNIHCLRLNVSFEALERVIGREVPQNYKSKGVILVFQSCILQQQPFDEDVAMENLVYGAEILNDLEVRH
jgi:hypothetical protein